MKSTFLSLDLKDAIKALVIAVLAAVLTAVQAQLTVGVLDWKEIGSVALLSTLAYITKNWLTNSEDKILIKEKK